jgi:AraC-like DNA-binding protein
VPADGGGAVLHQPHGTFELQDPGGTWMRAQFGTLEEHRAALRRARPDLGWTSNQLSAGRVSGSVISSRRDAVAVTCTRASGSFEMRGPVSTRNLVLSLSLESPTPGMQWMRPAHEGMVGVFLANTELDTINRGTVSFAVIDISHEALDIHAERLDVVIDPRKIAQSGIVPGQISAALRARVSGLVAGLHAGLPGQLPPGYRLDEMIISAAVWQLGRSDLPGDPMRLGGHHRIVARARAYIDTHLDSPISIDDLLDAAIASRRTLYRAFVETLAETPQSYILKLRLNRIRQDLATPDEAMRTVTVVSNRWGIAELGRLAARYREQFGELPRETLARRGLITAN